MAGCPDEDTLLALGRSRLDEGAREATLAHLDSCAVCRKVAAKLASEAPGTDDVATIGRYRLRNAIGAGAMGVVFAAHDPELDRHVAIKVLRRDRGGDDSRTLEQRLVGEARALAKLAHPNVIAAYEVGRHDGELYLAMELVAGSTLAQWLATAPRNRREILGAFLQAGAGLAAAHDAGIVHRDFKPDNVLVGDDGRVRVTDFGLASGGLTSTTPTTTTSVVLDEVALTRTGALAGTPAFMAPEQLAGAPATARSDQFSFAVALWTALYGVRPFEGTSVPALIEAARGKKFKLALDRDVPVGLRKAMVRALDAEPDARWLDVKALLVAIAPFEQPPASRRKLAVVAAATLVLGGSLAFGLERGGAGPTCDDTLADTIWSPDQRAAVERAFAVSPLGKPAVAAIDRAFERYRVEWAEARNDACRLGATQRTTCLDLQRAQIGALVRLFRDADAKIVENAVGAVSLLPDPAACAREPAGPQDPMTMWIAGAQRHPLARLAEIAALRLVGRAEQARDAAEVVLRDAERAGLDGVRGRALVERGNSREWTGQIDAAIVDYQAAIDLALVGRDDELLADALMGMTYAHVRAAHHERGELASALTASVIRRLGGDPTRESLLAQAMCMRAWRIGKDLEKGRAICEDARTKIIADGGAEDYRLPELENETGNVAFLQGRYEDAIAHYGRSIAGFARLAGATHPRARAARGNTAEAYVRLGRFAEAKAVYEQLLVEVPDSPAFHDGLAQAKRALGDHAGALEAHRATAQYAAKSGMVQDRCWGEVGIAEQLLALARFAEVQAALATARPICDQAGTPVDRARVAFAQAKLRHHNTDRAGASAALATARALAAEGGNDGPAKQLVAEIQRWAKTVDLSATDPASGVTPPR